MIRISTCLHRSAPFALAAALLLGAAACRKDGGNTRGKEATALYSHSFRLLKAYTDSMKLAADSARVLALEENLEKRLTQLNFKFPADTDLLLSEGENDTLAAMVGEFVKIKGERLYRFAHPEVRNDSDSVAASKLTPAMQDSVSRVSDASRKASSQNQR